MNILVVGGAGYIGSHCVRQIMAAGHRPVILDNFVYGHRGAVPAGVALHEGNLGDGPFVRRVLEAERIDAVMHFAAYCYVGESVTDPLKYYFTTSVATLQLLRCSAVARAPLKSRAPLQVLRACWCRMRAAMLAKFDGLRPFLCDTGFAL